MFIAHVLGVMRIGTGYSLVNTIEKKMIYILFLLNPIEPERKFVEYKLEAEK